MKKFSELTSEEIQNMSDEDFRNISPFEKRSCFDCGHIIKRVGLWCGSKEARNARGTSIPGCIKCPY